MTVTYTAEVATCRGFGCFLKLLVRWKGSIYKLVWPDLVAFLTAYYVLNLTYRFALDEEQKRLFESISEYCETYSNLIPLSFVLGFYISIIMQRWWDQYHSIPWPDPIAVFVSSHIHGQDERGRLMRRTIMRYVCLCLTMVFSMISPRVKKRFPTLEHFVDAGLLLDNEKIIVNDLNEKFPRHSKQWLPIVWAASIVTRARKEGRIRDDFSAKAIIDELNKFRGQCGLLLNYDTISVPLVYTQVVTLAVYSFFITSVMGRQWLEITDKDNPMKNHNNIIDLYFPLFITLQFFFYMGWLKVAESLINPFGEDDDDFEVNWIVDRNVTVSYLIVDEMHHEHPELIRDQYWDEVFPTELPYTIATEPFREKAPQPSTTNIAVTDAEAEYAAPSSLKIDEMSLNEQGDEGITFSAGRRSASRASRADRTMSAGSSNSLASSLHRVGSIASVIRRKFSRDPITVSVDGACSSFLKPDGSANDGKVGISNSTDSLTVKYVPGGSMRISDQVIEEVDEQLTITSSGRQEPRPSVLSIFPPTPASAPVPVPPGRQQHTPLISRSVPTSAIAPANPCHSPATSNVTYTEILSARSGLVGSDAFSGLGSGSIIHGDAVDKISIGSTTSISSDDDFERLKAKRQREKIQRNYARSISGANDVFSVDQNEAEALLLDISANSRTGLLPRSRAPSVVSQDFKDPTQDSNPNDQTQNGDSETNNSNAPL
nr:PREDICTED: bestrophin-2-like isoform X2 [Bemisia tabaci]